GGGCQPRGGRQPGGRCSAGERRGRRECCAGSRGSVGGGGGGGGRRRGPGRLGLGRSAAGRGRGGAARGSGRPAHSGLHATPQDRRVGEGGGLSRRERPARTPRRAQGEQAAAR